MPILLRLVDWNCRVITYYVQVDEKSYELKRGNIVKDRKETRLGWCGTKINVYMMHKDGIYMHE